MQFSKEATEREQVNQMTVYHIVKPRIEDMREDPPGVRRQEQARMAHCINKIMDHGSLKISNQLAVILIRIQVYNRLYIFRYI